VRQPEPPYKIRVIGAPGTPIRDLYFGLMRLSWPSTLAVIVGGYLLLNVLFALIFVAVGGIDHMRPRSLTDAFFFSVQTMGTIGYGAMSPTSNGANVVVVAESVVSLLFTATATGLVFAKFSRPNARVLFSCAAVIGPVDGKQCLSFRVGNQRASLLIEARCRVTLVRTETTAEGRTFYRMLDLPLARERMPSLSRSWSAVHVIDERSPLFGESEASAAAKDIEILITLTGTDDIWMQPVHATHRYFHTDIRWNARLADVLSEDGDDLVLDLRRFHDVEPGSARA
jgi:inward rectifier potassium channel